MDVEVEDARRHVVREEPRPLDDPQQRPGHAPRYGDRALALDARRLAGGDEALADGVVDSRRLALDAGDDEPREVVLVDELDGRIAPVDERAHRPLEQVLGDVVDTVGPRTMQGRMMHTAISGYAAAKPRSSSSICRLSCA